MGCGWRRISLADRSRGGAAANAELTNQTPALGA
jgi:hypothetical protein